MRIMKKYLYPALVMLAFVILGGIYFGNQGNSTNNTDQSRQTKTVKVFFSKNEPTDIVQIAVDRLVEAGGSQAELALAAVRAMLEGPTQAESDQGLINAINEGTVVNSVNIIGGVATVDFNATFDRNVAGAALVSAIRGQVESTLKQFAGVREIRMTINGGAREAVLEP